MESLPATGLGTGPFHRQVPGCVLRGSLAVDRLAFAGLALIRRAGRLVHRRRCSPPVAHHTRRPR